MQLPMYCTHVRGKTQAHLATYGRTYNTRTDSAEQTHGRRANIQHIKQTTHTTHKTDSKQTTHRLTHALQTYNTEKDSTRTTHIVIRTTHRQTAHIQLMRRQPYTTHWQKLHRIFTDWLHSANTRINSKQPTLADCTRQHTGTHSHIRTAHKQHRPTVYKQQTYARQINSTHMHVKQTTHIFTAHGRTIYRQYTFTRTAHRPYAIHGGMIHIQHTDGRHTKNTWDDG